MTIAPRILTGRPYKGRLPNLGLTLIFAWR
jgi:hypothetical protein